jgi:2-polyprenyl-3-methyl-5-hydroxy-6-metoxy-1,4-benzoquinol methylase
MTQAGCPICEGREYRELYDLESARWIPGKVVICRHCGTIYQRLSAKARPISEYYDESYASSDGWELEEQGAAAKALSRIADMIHSPQGPGDNQLLDVGCGSGVFLALAKDRGWNVTGIDLNPTLAQRARERCGAEVLVGDLLTTDVGGRKFNVITLLDLIEHLLEPLPVLRRCRELLAPRGTLVVYTPNHRGLICKVAHALFRGTFGRFRGPMDEIFDCTHLVFFDPASLRRALETCGFEIASTQFVKYDPSRSNLATGIAATAVRAIELVSPYVGGEFRVLMTGRVPA